MTKKVDRFDSSLPLASLRSGPLLRRTRTRTPSSTPVTARLLPAATEDALGLLLDDGKADARASAVAAIPDRRPDISLPLGPEFPERCGVKPASPPGPLAGAGSGEESVELRWRLWHKGEVKSFWGCG